MELDKRKNIRLREFDYSQEGGYFITLCTHQRRCMLSQICPGTEMNRASVILSDLGCIADAVLKQVSSRYGFRLDAYVIMPNHIHMVLVKQEGRESGITVGRMVGAYKSIVADQWFKICDQQGITAGKLWQRNYYDHILRNEKDYYEKIRYIDENPDKWRLDDMYRE